MGDERWFDWSRWMSGSQDRSRPSGRAIRSADKKTRRQIQAWLATPSEQPLGSVKTTHDEDDPYANLDAWQREAILNLLSGVNLVVDAPTSAGKTRVVEEFLVKSVEDPNFRACYTCPVKSLSNDKYLELRELLGAERVGIATGDYKENIHAPLLIATLETYRNSLLGLEPDLERNLVIFDEYHYIGDSDRGSAWEEAIILTPKSTQMILLSASVRNSGEFGEWIERLTGRKTEHVVVTKRPVPLVDLVWDHDAWILANELPGGELPKATNKDLAVALEASRIPLEDIAAAASGAHERGMTPGILYTGRRKQCEDTAWALYDFCDFHCSKEKQAEIEKVLESFREKFSLDDLIPEELLELILEHGIAYHHSGLHVQARIFIETLLKRGLLNYCVATMGLSLGINFSVRSTMICDFSRPPGVVYEPSEVLQMLGRAGRRGMDVVGFNLWPTPKSYSLFGSSEPQSYLSRLQVDITTLLGLRVRGFDIPKVERFYRSSFLRHKKKRAKLGMISMRRIEKHLDSDMLPCFSPASAFSKFNPSKKNSETPCLDCEFRTRCHKFIKEGLRGNALARLQLFLHKVGAFDDYEGVTPLGNLMRYFPQAGGAVIAHLIYDGTITEENLARSCELFACISVARFKFIQARTYRFPFDKRRILELSKWFYPENIYPDLYENDQLVHFNPVAGAIVQSWLRGTDWTEMCRRYQNERFAGGDIAMVLYRTATYLKAISQCTDQAMSQKAHELWKKVYRPPIQFEA